jgi:ribonuclease D
MTRASSSEVEVQVVREQADLEAACARLAEAGRLAFDTEFVGEDYYEAEICLIQAATDSFCVLVDPLAGVDVGPFWRLIGEGPVEVILHAGSEDLSICWKQTGKLPGQVVDLQIGAGLIGLGYPISLSRLISQTTGAKMHKTQTLTDWRRRPLSAEQVRYAVEDVVHLPKAACVLRDRLEELGRSEWLREECASMCRGIASTAGGEGRLRRLRGGSSLKGVELAVAEALLEERDKLAREYDRPPRAVLKDHLVIEIARCRWTEAARLRTLRGVNLSNTALRRLGAVIQSAKELPPEKWPTRLSEDEHPDDEVLTALTSSVLRDFCSRGRLSFSLLANKRDIRDFIRSYTAPEEPQGASRLIQGWRKEAVGELLGQLMAGERGVRVRREGKAYRLAVE